MLLNMGPPFNCRLPCQPKIGGPAPPPYHARNFVLVNDPKKLLQILKVIKPRRNHTFEIIQNCKPCKICMDFDNAAGFPRDLFIDRADFTNRIQATLAKIMQTDFGIQMNPADHQAQVFSPPGDPQGHARWQAAVHSAP